MHLQCGRFALDLRAPVVMGVLNVTPDSFSDGGRFLDVRAAVAHAERMAADGAAIIDVGGESTRPGSAPVSEDEELRRVLPVIERLAASLAIPVSIDTRKPDVMRRAIAAGASLVNDVAALTAPGAVEAVAGSDAAVCLMHMQGEPGTMQAAPRYEDVVAEVREFLGAPCRRLRSRGHRAFADRGRPRIRLRQVPRAQPGAAGRVAGPGCGRPAGARRPLAQADDRRAHRP